MKYLLDTNAVIALLADRPPTIRRRFHQVASEAADVFVSSIVLFELWYGVARSEYRERNTERLRTFLAGKLGVMRFEEEDGAIAGALRADLERAGTPIGPYDLLIAGQALRTGAILVTANVAEFRRVPGLAWEDWTQAA